MMEKMKLLALLSFLLCTTTHSKISCQRFTEGNTVTIPCPKEQATQQQQKVLWEKEKDGHKWVIFTKTEENTEKHAEDPENRFFVLDDFSLGIRDVSVSDSGIYYCNKTAVKVTVTAAVIKENKTTAACGESETPVFENKLNANELQNVTVEINTTRVTDVLTNSTSTPETSPDVSLDDKNVSKTTNANINQQVHTTKPGFNATSHFSEHVTRTVQESLKTKLQVIVLVAVAGVFLLLLVLLLRCKKRKAAAEQRNIYETVDDADCVLQPAPQAKKEEPVYYLAGDPDVIKLGQRSETEDHTYSMISEDQFKEKPTENEQESLYSLLSAPEDQTITNNSASTENTTTSPGP